MKLVSILALLLFVSCASQTPTPPVVDEKPVVVTPTEHKFAWNNKERTEILVDEIVKNRGPHRSVKENFRLVDMKPNDWRDYIDVWPKNEEGVIKFWGNILVAMAKYESNYKSSAKYQEAFKDRHGKRIWSRGLFQLSIESGRGYGCDIKTDTDLHKDKVNINCAVQILAYWVKRDGVIRAKTSGWRGAARYWSVVRGTYNQHTKNALAAIKKANR